MRARGPRHHTTVSARIDRCVLYPSGLLQGITVAVSRDVLMAKVQQHSLQLMPIIQPI